MPIQPRIDDPSKPSPSRNVFSSHKSIGNEQCCHVPSISTNFKSTISALFSFASLKKSPAVMARPPLCARIDGADGWSITDLRQNALPGQFGQHRNAFVRQILSGVVVTAQNHHRRRDVGTAGET